MPCGNRNHSQCDHTSTFSQARKLPGVASARWSRSVGVVPEPDRLVDAHRVGDPHPPLERLRVVVGHLVGGDVGPHLQHARRRRRARASAGRARRGRTGRGPRYPVTTGGGELQPPADERRRDPGDEGRTRGHADGGGQAHGAGECSRAGGRSGGRHVDAREIHHGDLGLRLERGPERRPHAVQVRARDHRPARRPPRSARAPPRGRTPRPRSRRPASSPAGSCARARRATPGPRPRSPGPSTAAPGSGTTSRKRRAPRAGRPRGSR